MGKVVISMAIKNMRKQLTNEKYCGNLTRISLKVTYIYSENKSLNDRTLRFK